MCHRSQLDVHVKRSKSSFVDFSAKHTPSATLSPSTKRILNLNFVTFKCVNFGSIFQTSLIPITTRQTPTFLSQNLAFLHHKARNIRKLVNIKKLSAFQYCLSLDECHEFIYWFELKFHKPWLYTDFGILFIIVDITR